MQEQDRNRKYFIIMFIILAFLVGAVIGIIAFRSGQPETGNQTGGIVLDENASAWDEELNDLSGEESGIKIPGYSDITVPAGESTWEITLANPKDNNCYFRYSITIDDDETPVYESDYIEPGKAVTEFEVSEPLEEGEYVIYLNISACSMDGENTQLNGASVKADLHVVE